MKLSDFEFYCGPVNSVESYNAYLAEAARMTGRTTALVQAASEVLHSDPEENVAIVVTNMAYGKEIAAKIGMQIPWVDKKRIRLVSINPKKFTGTAIVEHEKLRGWKGKVFVDNCLYDMLIPRVGNLINEFFDVKQIKKKNEMQELLTQLRDIVEQIEKKA
tara:strand:- start:6 stop:488 length:483 start_codon:yes stop_codon:yes gene_type:complete